MRKPRITSQISRIPVISIVGTSNAGKTILLANIIPILTTRGFRVGVIKHHGHRYGHKTHSRSDTAIIRDSGAAVTILVGPGINDGDIPPQEVIKNEMIGKVDLVLTEGYKNGPFPKIGISWPGRPDQIEPDGSWIASIGGDFDDLPFFTLTDDRRLAEFIIAQLPKRPQAKKKPALTKAKTSTTKTPRKTPKKPKAKAKATPKSIGVSLMVNGRNIELNRFVSIFIKRTVTGMLSSLRDCKNPKETVIHIRHED